MKMLEFIFGLIFSGLLSAEIDMADTSSIELPALSQKERMIVKSQNSDIVLRLSNFEKAESAIGIWKVHASPAKDCPVSGTEKILLGTFSTYGMSSQTEHVITLKPAYKVFGNKALTISFTPESTLNFPDPAGIQSSSLIINTIERDIVKPD